MAKKVRSFTAKLAHNTNNLGKNICSVCDSEIKKIKLIRAKSSKAKSWSPSFEMKSICKCNESKVLM